MTENGELRGSTPIYTAKDILVGLDRKVGEMDLKLDGLNTSIQILVSQNLNSRMVHMESMVHKLEGAGLALKAVFGTSVFAVIVGVVALLKSLGAF